MQNKGKGILALILASLTLLVVTLAAFGFWNRKVSQNYISEQMTTPSPEVQMVDETSLENYYFCGRTHKVNSVVVDGIDVVGRISEIAFENLENQICNNTLSAPGQKILTAEIRQFPEDVDYKPTDYYLQIEQSRFKIDVEKNEIYLLGGFAGELTPIGHLKLVVSEPVGSWKKTCKNLAAGYQVRYPDEWSTIVGNDMAGFSVVDACDLAKEFGTKVNNVGFASYDMQTMKTGRRGGIWITAVPDTVKHDFADSTNKMEMLVDGERMIWIKDDRVGARLLHHGTKEYQVVISEDVPEELVTEFFSTFKFLK